MGPRDQITSKPAVQNRMLGSQGVCMMRRATYRGDAFPAAGYQLEAMQGTGSPPRSPSKALLHD